MTKQEKHSYFKAIYKRYHKAKRIEKGKILDEFCAVCGYKRKYAIRKLNHPPKKQQRKKPGRRSVYKHPEILSVIKTIWFASDQMCGKRLVAAIPLWLPHYEAQYKPLTDEVKKKVLSISAASIDRLLSPLRAHKGGGLSGTKPGTLLKNQIPIRTDNWDISQPGFMEADTVAHCGNSLMGDFVWSLTLTDILTEWTECRATWNKGSIGVVKQIKSIEKALPFSLKGFDCDNGLRYKSSYFA